MIRPKPRRRWLQFSLKSLLLVLLVVSSFLAGRVSLTRKLEQMRAEAKRQRAIAETNQQRAMEALYRYQVQLVERELTETVSDPVRQRLLLRAKEQYDNLLREEGGNGQQE